MTVVGILVCDHFPDEAREVAGGDIGDLYVDLLRGADSALDLRVFHPVDGELPGLDECDAWIITGSRADAHGDDPWVVALREWVSDADAAGARIAGVCFGHQVVAHALGGRTERSEQWKVGPLPMTVEPTPWFDAATVEVNAMHRDEVTALPPGARAIATGPSAAIPAFVIGDRVLCIQDHPEFTNDLTEAVIRGRVDRLGEDVAADGLARVASTPAQGEVVATWLAAFLTDRRR